jgi:1,2-diacylglycerol-3-alpha-glucose alpha-1,2-galactosyltransferase
MKNKLRVNMLSESEFTVKGHGVHTAYVELTRALSKRPDIDIAINEDRPADITHLQTIGFYAVRRLLFGPGKKVVSAHVVPDSVVGSIVLAKYWKSAFRVYMKWFYGRADMVLAVSKMVKDELEQDMGLKNVELFYNTIDMQRYHRTKTDIMSARKKLKIATSKFVVVGNGQIQPRKRFDIFLEMARRMPDVQFIWVGGMPFKNLAADYSKMKKLVDSRPENLMVTDVIPLEQVRAYYHAADVFVLPAEQENHPMCVLEAAGSGLPIVLRKIPQYDDTFSDAALLANSDKDFVRIVKKLYTDKTARAAAIKKSAIIAKRFDSTEGAKRAVDFYRSLLK